MRIRVKSGECEVEVEGDEAEATRAVFETLASKHLLSMPPRRQESPRAEERRTAPSPRTGEANADLLELVNALNDDPDSAVEKILTGKAQDARILIILAKASRPLSASEISEVTTRLRNRIAPENIAKRIREKVGPLLLTHDGENGRRYTLNRKGDAAVSELLRRERGGSGANSDEENGGATTA